MFLWIKLFGCCLCAVVYVPTLMEDCNVAFCVWKSSIMFTLFIEFIF
jgi:hypothetical protein